MNAHQEIEAYRGWPVTHYGPTKTGLLFSAPDGPFVPVYLADRLAREIEALNQRVNQLSDANTYLRTMIQNDRDRLNWEELKEFSTGRGPDFPQ